MVEKAKCGKGVLVDFSLGIRDPGRPEQIHRIQLITCYNADLWVLALVKYLNKTPTVQNLSGSGGQIRFWNFLPIFKHGAAAAGDLPASQGDGCIQALQERGRNQIV